MALWGDRTFAGSSLTGTVFPSKWLHGVAAPPPEVVSRFTGTGNALPISIPFILVTRQHPYILSQFMQCAPTETGSGIACSLSATTRRSNPVVVVATGILPDLSVNRNRKYTVDFPCENYVLPVWVYAVLSLWLDRYFHRKWFRVDAGSESRRRRCACCRRRQSTRVT